MGSLFSIGESLIDFILLQKVKALKRVPPHAHQGKKFLVSPKRKE